MTVTRTPEPLARVPYAVGVLDRTAIQRGQQTIGIDEALNNIPGVVVVQPLQLLARPAHLDPRLRQPLQLRRARAQDPAGRRSADAARRPEPAHQRRLRRHRPGRGAARRQLVALRQRVRRRDLVPDRARRAGAVRPAGAGAGRQRRAGRRRVLQVAELDIRPRRAAPAARCRSRSSRPTASGSTAPRRSASSTPAWTTPSAARRSARSG